MAELGVGYISIVPEVSKISPSIAEALGATSPVAEKSGKTMGAKLSSGINKTLKASAIGIGTTAGGFIAAGLTKGFGRLQAIEGAQSKLSGLGSSAQQVSGIMDNALAAVKGTAHGLGEAASVSAQMVAAGIEPGQQLEQTLKTVGDTAAIAGRSMEDVGLIFGSVAARGKLQGDDMLQLMSSGIPVLQLLSKELGVTSAEVSDMVSAGEVDFATFEKAMREGMGGAALEMGDTFSGAVANMGAAAGRVGATVLDPFFDLSKDGFGAVTKALDGLDERLGPVMDSFGAWLQNRAVPAIKDFGSEIAALSKNAQLQTVLSATQTAFSQLWSTGQKLLPVIGSLVQTFGQASASLGLGLWKNFANVLTLTGSALESLAGPLGSVADFLSNHPALVTAAVGAWAGFKTIPNLISKITGAVNPHVSSLKTMGEGVKDLKSYYEATGREISTFGATIQYAATSNNKVVADMARAYDQAAGPAQSLASSASNAMAEMDASVGHSTRSVSGAVKKMSGTVKGVGAAAFTGLQSAAGSVMSLFGGPWGLAFMGATAAVGAVASANSKAKIVQDAYAKATREAATAQDQLNVSLAGTSAALSDAQLSDAAAIVNKDLVQMKTFAQEYSGWFNTISAPDLSWWQQGHWSADWRAYANEVNQAKDAYEAIEKSAGELKIPMEDLNRVVAEGGPEYDKLIASLRQGGDASQMAADQLAEARDNIQQSIDAARNLDPVITGVSNAMGVLADESSTAQDKLAALNDIMDKLTGGALSHDEAQAKLVEDVQETTEAIAEMAGKLAEVGPVELDPDNTIDATTEAGKEAVRTISDIAQTMKEAASNGVSVDEIFDQQADNLTALQEALGLTDEQFQNVMQAYGLTREIFALPLEMEGAQTVEEQVKAIELGLSRLGEGQSVQIEPPDPAVAAVLEDIGYKVEYLDNGQFEITATADVDAADLDNLGEKVKEIQDLHAEATAGLDTTMFALGADEAKQLGRELDELEVSPEADLTIDKLMQGKDVSIGELQALAREVSTPTADLDKMLLDAGVEDSKVKLADLNKQKTKPTIDVNAEPAKQGINSVSRMLQGLKDKVINIFTRRRDAAADGLINYGSHRFLAAGGAGRMSQQPAQIAAGGRWITWAEDETQGESFIPHAPSKRKRSTQILAETASIFGLGLVDAGGNQIRRDGSSVAPTSRSYMADGGVSPDQLLRYFKGERVNGQQASRSLQGAPYVFGGSNWGDCSSTQGQGALFAVGEQADRGRFMSTADEKVRLASIGFSPGLGSGPRYAIGWYNGGVGGGHTSGTIHFGDGHSVNVEMGGGAGGQGKIGGAAAGAAHPQYAEHAHLPLGVELSAEIHDLESGDIDHTSVDGYTTKSGKTVSWGKAQEYYDMALEFQKRTRVHDRGGIMKDGRIAINMSGKDERILSPMETVAYERSLDVLPRVTAQFDSAVNKFVGQADAAQRQTASYGRHFGGDYLASAEIVRDAEQGLLDTRRAIADENDEVVEREEALAEAKKELAKVEKEGGGLTTAQKRKLADAEENLAKARKDGKPDKIADAEKKLARAREDVDEALQKSQDKNAKAVAAAQKKVNKAEDALADAREQTADQSDRLIAAERAVAAARYKAAGDMAESIFESVSKGFMSISGFFDEMERLAEIVERTRQEVSKLEMQQQTNAIERLRSLAELQLREQDVARARARGALSVAEAEADLEDARNAAARMGSTSIEAMSGAMDRFRTTGIFAVEEVAESVVENTAEVKAAEWGVKVARAQAALDEFEATRQQAIAQLEVAQATLTQTAAAELLTLQTQQLQQQAANLYGMTANQASGAARGFGGVGKVTGGIGKIIGGVLAGIAGFAVGGPVGALAGAGLALGGLKDTVQGSIDIHQNKKEMGEAWKNLDAGSKAGIVLGSAGGAALGIAGGALSGQYGTEMATAGAELGAQFTEATIGSLQYGIAGRIDKLKRDSEDQTAELQRKTDRDQLALDMLKAQNEVDYITKKDVLESNLEHAKLQQQLATAQSEGVIKALEKASKVEQDRANKAHVEQMGIISDTNKHLQELVTLTRNDKGANSETGKQLAAAVGGINKLLLSLSTRPLSTADGNRFAEARI
ncbi:tape measure protein [Corynebacterium aurimucosum]|nr:tape measure protein [Corynebacterium aurimucosum]NJJ84266.1 tape measure protein [Corynebacterium aurimucosum]